MQHALERGTSRNPDSLVELLLDAPCRESALDFARDRKASGLAAHPFYNYLLLRTRYYDDSVLRALRAGVRQVLIIGAGTDTRAYRFRSQLQAVNATVIECDLPAAIAEKEKCVGALGDHRHVRFSALDLIAPPSEEWFASSGYDREVRCLILIEGVTPYVPEKSFERWLDFFSKNSPEGTMLCCDYKLRGGNDEFGQSGPNSARTLRLGKSERAVAEFHRRCGWSVQDVQHSESLAKEYEMASDRALCRQDVIVCSLRATSQSE